MGGVPPNLGKPSRKKVLPRRYILSEQGNKTIMSYGCHILPITPSGDLTVNTAPMLRRTLDELQHAGVRYLVINMEHVDFVDSAGMAVIFSAVRCMRESDGALMLVNVSPNVFRALRIARLVDMVPVRKASERKAVPELDAGAMPLWRTTVPVCATEMQEARLRITELASQLPFNEDDMFDLTLAVGEALGNAADHTCGDGILSTVCAYDDRIVVEVTDCGEGFDPCACPDCDCGDDRGRGIKLMQLLVDDVDIRPKPSGTGMVVRLVKLVSARTTASGEGPEAYPAYF